MNVFPIHNIAPFCRLKTGMKSSENYLSYGMHSHRVNEIMSLSSSTFLLISFLVVLFFIATGSILYFNNISAVFDSKSDYKILSQMGYTDRKLKRIIRKQILTFFGIPFLFGLADCIFATMVYKNILFYYSPYLL